MVDVVIFVLVGIVTLAMRGVFIIGLAGRPLPPLALEWLDNARPAILAALVAGFLAGGDSTPTFGAVAGVIAAGLVMRRIPNMLLALAVGVAVTLVL